MTTPMAYTVKTAAEASGFSIDVIKRAIRSGDLRATRPKIDGREVAKDSILAADLERWLTGGAK